MKIIAIVGTGSGCGKTTVACHILRAIPGLGAVKISPRDGVSRVEWGVGEPGKDTDLYDASGAVKVARIIGPREAVVSTWERIKSEFEGCQGVVVEGASALCIPEERFVVFVIGAAMEKRRDELNRAIADNSDIIVDRSSHQSIDSSLNVIHAFLISDTNE